jgi:predicted aspartyl protease
MGTFYVHDCEVINLARRHKSEKVSKLLVDTGSEYTWLPEALLQKAGITRQKKDLQFIMANGQPITRSVGYAVVKAGEFETVDEVVFALPGDLNLLGARTLEGFAVVVDPRKKKLVAAGPIPVASNRCIHIGNPSHRAKITPR